MSNAASIARIAESPVGWGIVVGIGALAFWLIHDKIKKDVTDTADAIGEGVTKLTEGAVGIATGHNTITADTPYEGAGIIGTDAAIVDSLSGGFFSNVGSWLGTHLYDYTHDDDSASTQSSTGNPYSPTGKDATYREAANNSPLNAQYAASPLGYNIDIGSAWTPGSLY